MVHRQSGPDDRSTLHSRLNGHLNQMEGKPGGYPRADHHQLFAVQEEPKVPFLFELINRGLH